MFLLGLKKNAPFFLFTFLFSLLSFFPRHEHFAIGIVSNEPISTSSCQDESGPSFAKRPKLQKKKLPSFKDQIDVVYTWVDGSDQAWQALRRTWAGKEGVGEGQAKRRFRDRDELRYSLRSLHMFAPFIHHIYIVTCGQRPSWLKNHPKVSLVDHRTIFKNPSDLPTFNSMAIESHLHRIPGLKEHYIYFNDDVFLGKKVTYNDFFTKKGKIRVFLSKHKMTSGIPQETEAAFRAAIKNTAKLLSLSFGKKTRTLHAHTPFPSLKSLVGSIENRFPKAFGTDSSHRFRSIQDFLLVNGLIPHVALEKGKGVKSPPQSKTISFGKHPTQDKGLLQSILLEKPRFFCIQDSSDDENLESAAELHNFFEKYYPQRAPWERKNKATFEPKKETPPIVRNEEIVKQEVRDPDPQEECREEPSLQPYEDSSSTEDEDLNEERKDRGQEEAPSFEEDLSEDEDDKFPENDDEDDFDEEDDEQDDMEDLHPLTEEDRLLME
jgi:hypothetical protein